MAAPSDSAQMLSMGLMRSTRARDTPLALANEPRRTMSAQTFMFCQLGSMVKISGVTTSCALQRVIFTPCAITWLMPQAIRQLLCRRNSSSVYAFSGKSAINSAMQRFPSNSAADAASLNAAGLYAAYARLSAPGMGMARFSLK